MQQARLDLGRRLRGLRVEAGLSARQLAARCGWHESKVSKLQHAKVLPSEADLRSWAAHCGVPEQADDLVAAGRGVEGMYVEWRRRNSSGLGHIQRSTVPLYERTRHFRIYEPGVIPGLLQTADYARALMTAIIRFKGIPDDAEAAVAARIGKQRILQGRRTFAFLLEESALRAQVADAEVMSGQLGSLLHAACQPQISLGVIPSAAAERAMWPVEGFWIFDRERVLVELVSAEVTVVQPHEIDLYERTFSELAKAAVYGPAARAVVADALSALS
jgi:transcriptional regulator with XRE-family HTH domain